MQYLLLIIALVIAIFSVIFALQNAVPIVVNLLVWEFESSLALVLLVTLGVGIIIGLLGATPSTVRKSMKISHQNKRIKQLQATIADHEVNREPQIREVPPEAMSSETDEQRLE